MTTRKIYLRLKMVIALVKPAIIIAQQIIKHRKAIYAVLTAQDRYISSAFRYGGYGKATSYGVRSGALAGSIAGAFISNAPDTPGNGIQTPFQKQPATSKQDQTRRRQSSSKYGRNANRDKYNRYCRQSRY